MCLGPIFEGVGSRVENNPRGLNKCSTANLKKAHFHSKSIGEAKEVNKSILSQENERIGFDKD